MAYNIQKSDGTAVTIADGDVDYSQFSIGLVGKNTIGYGDEIAQNFVQMLENFASTSQPDHPTIGQLYYDTTPGSESLKVRTADGFRDLVTTDVNGDVVAKICGVTNIGSVGCKFDTVYANTFEGEATSALYADLAERYESDEPLAPGTVVKIGGDKEITKTTSEGCVSVFGVVSTQPGLMLNSAAGDDQTHPYVALAGRVPVKVHGTCKKGDRLMASGEHAGEAVVAPEQHDYRAIIGRALEDKESQECGEIEAVVGAK